jgi:hypothetical protein
VADVAEPSHGYNPARYQGGRAAPSGYEPTNLADVLDRVLDKGLVIAGDISISLAQVELLTIKIRLLLASADKAKEMGIDWWTRDPALTGRPSTDGQVDDDEEKQALRQRIDELERQLRTATSGVQSVAGRSQPRQLTDVIDQLREGQSGTGAPDLAQGAAAPDDGDGDEA